MQKTIYQCDQCKKEIGAKAHVTMNFAGNGNTSGVATPPGTHANGWYVVQFPRNWIHLHGACVEKYFKALVETAEKKSKK